MTGVRKEIFSWVVTVLVAIVTSLVVVQLAVALAFAAQDHSPLEVAALRQRAADYSADDASAPLLEALDAAILEEAAEEDSALNRANDERGLLNLPTEPPAASSLIDTLFSAPASIPTVVVEIPVSATPAATLTSAASPTNGVVAASPTSAVSATLTASPPDASATNTLVVRSATTSANTLAATASATPPTNTLAPTTASPSAATNTATHTATKTSTLANSGAASPTSTRTRTFTSSATLTLTATRTATRTATPQSVTNTPTASPTLTQTLTATFTSTPAAALPADVVVRVNFQPSGAPAPEGYLVDGGAAYGDRGNGWQYGWNRTNNAAVDRNSNLSPDQRFDTLLGMQYGGWYEWEIAMPLGVYTVHIVAGDPCCTDARYRIRVESITVVNGSPRPDARWVEGTAQVTVTDGRLTVSNGGGADNNRINFIEIYSGIQAPEPTASFTHTAPPTNTTTAPQSTSSVNNSTDSTASPTASVTPVPSVTLAPSGTPSLTPSPTPTVRPRNTRWPTRTPTPTRTFTSTSTSSPTRTFTPSPTLTPSVTPTPSVTFSPSPSATASPTPAATSTPATTASPSATSASQPQSLETTPTTGP